jgi:hypothetical protein
VPALNGPAHAADSATTTMAERRGDAAPRETSPTEDDIRTRAYHRYLERGGGDGQAFDDWLEAERELRSLKSDVGSLK